LWYINYRKTVNPIEKHEDRGEIMDKKKLLGASKTEAWADISYRKKKTNVPIPSVDAVDRAKAWVEENEK